MVNWSFRIWSRIPSVHSFLFTLLVHYPFWNSARPMEIQVVVEVVLIEDIDRLGMRRRNVQIPHVLPYHRAILGFGQPVVIGPPRPRFGLFDQQLV